jgi:hypothetical protein
MVWGDGRVERMCMGRCVAGAKSGKAGEMDGVARSNEKARNQPRGEYVITASSLYT